MEIRNGVMFKVSVSPGRNEFEVKGFDLWSNSLLLCTKEPAERGRANKEIEKELGRLFGSKTKIIKGFHTGNKAVEVQGRSALSSRAIGCLIL